MKAKCSPGHTADTQWALGVITTGTDSGRQRWSKADGSLGVYQALCVLKTLEKDSQRLMDMGMGLRMSLWGGDSFY